MDDSNKKTDETVTRNHIENKLICDSLTTLINRYPNMPFQKILLNFGYVEQEGKCWKDNYKKSNVETMMCVADKVKLSMTPEEQKESREMVSSIMDSILSKRGKYDA